MRTVSIFFFWRSKENLFTINKGKKEKKIKVAVVTIRYNFLFLLNAACKNKKNRPSFEAVSGFSIIKNYELQKKFQLEKCKL